VPAVWVFLLDAGKNGRSWWYWARSGPQAEGSRRRFRSFDECVTDAREHGFDFDQPYHVTATS
jgi:hypothetical protein